MPCPGSTVTSTSRRLSSADGGLKRLAEGTGLVRGKLDNQPATAFQRDAHDDAAALLGDLKRTVTRPRLHRRHPAPLPCSGAAPNRNRRIRPTHGAWRYSSQPHTSRSVPLLSRVRPLDGNDQRSRPVTIDTRPDQGTRHLPPLGGLPGRSAR